MKGSSIVSDFGDEIVKVFDLRHPHGEVGFRREKFALEHLAGTSLIPRVIEIGGNYIRMEKHGLLLHEWIKKERPLRPKNEMKERLVKAMKGLRNRGIAHRDLHAKNILLDGDLNPLFIDFEFSTACNPSLPSYDLLGPKASMIDPPHIHAELDIEVFWNSNSNKVSSLSHYFGVYSE